MLHLRHDYVLLRRETAQSGYKRFTSASQPVTQCFSYKISSLTCQKLQIQNAIIASSEALHRTLTVHISRLLPVAQLKRQLPVTVEAGHPSSL